MIRPKPNIVPGWMLGVWALSLALLPQMLLGQNSTGARPRPASSMPARMSVLPSGAKVAIIRIDGLIYEFTDQSFRRRVEQARADGCTLIVVELDTPGGTLIDSMRISRSLKQLSDQGVPTLAWVNDQAYSGGTVVAAACHWIVMAPSSVLGDCAPIIPGQSLSPTERAKALSPLLADFQESAQRNNYDFPMFDAMCELGVELYFIENPATGQRRIVNKADYLWMVHASPGSTPAPGSASGNISPAPTPSGPDGSTPDTSTTRRVSTDADAGQWRIVTQGRHWPSIPNPLHDGRTLLTLSQDQAMELGLAQATVRDDADLARLLNAASVTRYDQLWVEGAAYWLTRPWVKALLLMVVLLGFYLEFQAPGISLPGILAVTALVVLLGAPFLIGLASWWHVALVVVGVILLAVELFVTPGFGVIGVAGIVCVMAGVVLMGVPTRPGSPLPSALGLRQLQWSIFFVLLAVVASGVIMALLAKHFGSLPVFNRMILQHAQAGAAETGPSITPGLSGGETLGSGRIQLGAEGEVVSDLKPTGRIRLGDAIVDVSSRGEWIEPGRRVRVVELAGNIIFVEAV